MDRLRRRVVAVTAAQPSFRSARAVARVPAAKAAAGVPLPARASGASGDPGCPPLPAVGIEPSVAAPHALW